MSASSQFQMDGTADRKARETITVFVRWTDNVLSPIDLSEWPGRYLNTELTK